MKKPSTSILIHPKLSLVIKPTANAWWKKRFKIYRLLAGLSVGWTVSDICKNAGITEKNYKYFIKVHPQMKEIAKYYEEELISKARTSVEKGIRTDKRFALRYLMKNDPDKFPPPFLLNKIKRLNQELEGERSKHLEELRLLKQIIEMYRESSYSLSDSRAQRMAKSADKLILRYNHIYYGKTERVKRTPEWRVKERPNERSF